MYTVLIALWAIGSLFNLAVIVIQRRHLENSQWREERKDARFVRWTEYTNDRLGQIKELVRDREYDEALRRIDTLRQVVATDTDPED